jgi:ESS family glutamate:Na+ symporter
MIWEIDPFGTVTIAICVFFIGNAIVMRSAPLRAYGIPESVVGGFACALIIALIYHAFDRQIVFDLVRRDLFLVYFFAALGLRSKLREIAANGRPLLVLVVLATVFIFIQNSAGMAIASAFNLDPKLGIVTGSMALTGRSGTTVAWAPFFEERFGLEHLSRLGVAANMLGLIAACLVGGPIARLLVTIHRLDVPGQSAALDVGISRDVAAPQLDYRAFLLALLRIHVAILGGQVIDLGLAAVGVQLPLYVSCLLGGIIIGNLMPVIAPGLDWPGSDQCLSLIAEVSLGLFYTMTLMSLQLWDTQGLLDFLLVMIVVQSLLTIGYACLVVFRAMGGHYQAAVMSAGFAGMSLGSTATTMAIMTAVAKQYGRAQNAFIIVPLACGFFIDIANSLAIAFFAGL